MTTRATHPTAQALLGWMQANPGRLRARLDAAAAGGGDLSPMGDLSIVAHLAFVADAVAATAAPAREEALRAFAAGAMEDMWRERAQAEENMVAVGEAHALEARLQFGDGHFVHFRKVKFRSLALSGGRDFALIDMGRFDTVRLKTSLT